MPVDQRINGRQLRKVSLLWTSA